MRLVVHIDGGSRGNPGPAAVGVVMRDADSNKVLHEAGYYLGTATNNVAEYRGLLRAVTLAVEMGAEQTSIHSDSELMVKQVLGEYKVKSPDLKPLHEEAQHLLVKLGSWQIKHVRREQNTRADELVNLALDARRDVVAVSGGNHSDSAMTPTLTADSGGLSWARVRLEKDPGKACPAQMRKGQWVTFGPGTPQGFCVYGAKAVLDAMLPAPGQPPQANPVCPRCRVPMTIDAED
ncbi:MAG: reverse transcriptase-like protein [Phycisphaera sp.]|nr:reverse transcriptase-like protein [Phycisphaera sp.]